MMTEPARSAIQQVQPVRSPYPKTPRRVLEHSPHVVIGQRVRIMRVVMETLHDPAVPIQAIEPAIERAHPHKAVSIFDDPLDLGAAQRAGIAFLVGNMCECPLLR